MVLTEPAPSLWERVICGVIIAMMTGALIGPVFAPLQEETPVLRLVWLPAYAAIVGLLLFRIDRLWRAWPAMIAIAALIGLDKGRVVQTGTFAQLLATPGMFRDLAANQRAGGA